MASLANQTISSTYDGLVKTSTDQPVGVSGVQLLEDGVGNSLALSVGRANQGVTITGTLSATSISGVLADGVTATTQTSGDNSTKVATTAYVDAATPEVHLDLAGDSGTGTVDLATQSLTIEGTANEIETSASGQTITIGLPSSVTVGTLTATTLAGTLSTAAQTNITSVGTLSSLAVSGNLTVDTDTLFVDSVNNRVGIGTTDTLTRKFRILGSGDLVDITSTNSGVGGAQIDLRHTSPSPADGDNVGIINFAGLDSGLAGTQYASIKAIASSVSTETGELHFGTRENASTYNGSAMILNGSGNLVFPNGNGIDFSATAGGGATSSLLDDYEEGTFTPFYEPSSGSFTTMTMDNGTTKYTKIGNVVTLYVYMKTDNVDITGGSGSVLVKGLPFTVSGTAGGVALVALNFVNLPDSGFFVNGTDYIILTKNGGINNLDVADLTTGAVNDQNALLFTATYMTS